MPLQATSLQQRNFFSILLPTFLLLSLLSFGGFFFVRSLLLAQWGEVAISKLQQTAHRVDMRLARVKEMLQILETGEGGTVSQEMVGEVLARIGKMPGVVAVAIDWPSEAGMAVGPRAGQDHCRLESFTISPPQHNQVVNDRTVSLLSSFVGGEGERLGQVEVQVSFTALTESIVNHPWWQKYKVYLVDSDGSVLVTAGDRLGLEDYYPLRAFGTVSPLEEETLAAMGRQSSGTLFGPGRPPEEISGFYRLAEAPWTLVVIAQGREVMQPIIRFKYVYFSVITLGILAILFFIRRGTCRLTGQIKGISAEADNLASGRFGPPLTAVGRDEVAELTRSFNKMSRQLQHRLALKEAIDLAREVQQKLLPTGGFAIDGIRVAGRSRYCEETGGDYFDILHYPQDQGKLGVVVGDVVGHGIGAALLMTTLRALLRCRISNPGRADEIVTAVNALLCSDTVGSGNFATLFYLEIDARRQTIGWVRAGHEPALVFQPESGTFFELKGRGLALGVDPAYRFEYNEHPLGSARQLILLGSDGLWEVENGAGEQFGKERLRHILIAHPELEPEPLLELVFAEIDNFRGGERQQDDITLAVIRS